VSKKTELLERRAQIHSEATLLMKAEQTAETRAKVKTMFTDIDAIGQDLANIERADKVAAELATRSGAIAPNAEQHGATAEAEEYRNAYWDFMQNGRPNTKAAVRGGAAAASFATLEETKATVERMLPEQRSKAVREQVEAERRMARLPLEKRDQQAGSQSIVYTEGNLGGYFVPAGFVYDIDVATKYFAPLLDGSTIRVMETATGNVLPYPTSNDTNDAWTLLAENQQVVDNGVTPNYPNQGASAPTANPGNVLAGQVSFSAYKGTTGLIRVSLELMQDSAFSLEAFLKEAFSTRLGRGYEYFLTQGSGVNAPLGFIPAIAASGATPVVAQGSFNEDGISGNTGVNSIGWQDLVNVEHSVDPTYRRGAKWQMSDLTLASLKTRVDKFGRPFWVPAVKDGMVDTILGYPYVINQSMAQIGASATVIAFGQWSKFIARKVRDLSIARLDERFADYGQVAYVGFSRIDSRLVDAGTHPLNVLVMHS
jgi:HK97 family phage major capsid protein